MYRNWVRSGWLIATDGDCIDYDKIRDDILKDAQRFQLLNDELAFDDMECNPFTHTIYKRQGLRI